MNNEQINEYIKSAQEELDNLSKGFDQFSDEIKKGNGNRAYNMGLLQQLHDRAVWKQNDINATFLKFDEKGGANFEQLVSLGDINGKFELEQQRFSNVIDDLNSKHKKAADKPFMSEGTYKALNVAAAAIGAALCLTGVGALVGVPLLIGAVMMNNNKEKYLARINGNSSVGKEGKQDDFQFIDLTANKGDRASKEPELAWKKPPTNTVGQPYKASAAMEDKTQIASIRANKR